MRPLLFIFAFPAPARVLTLALALATSAGCADGQVVEPASRSLGLFEAWAQPDADGVGQIYLGSAQQRRNTPDAAKRLTFGPSNKSAPSMVFAPSTNQWLVTYVNEVAPGHNEIRALAVDPSFSSGCSPSVVVAAAVVRPFGEDPSEQSSFYGPQAVWVPTQAAAFVVFHTPSAVFHAWLRPQERSYPLATETRFLTGDRHGRVSHPTVAYASATDRLMVAWGIMRSQEDIELGVMSPGDSALSIPSRRSWKHKRRECNDELAPACIEGGDVPALAYNERLRMFGLAIADDLNDGSRVEGFLLNDDCGKQSCGVTKVGSDDDMTLPEDQRERSLVRMARVASVSIASTDDGFMVDFAYGGDGPHRLSAAGAVMFDGEGRYQRADTL